MSISIRSNNISSSTGTVTIDGNIAADNLSKVAFSGSYNDLTNKPNIGSGGQLADSWEQDGNFWRKYDDGYIEQGGISTTRGGDTTTITLNTSFTGTDYYANVVPTGNNSQGVQDAYTQFNRTTTTFQMFSWKMKFSDGYVWYACGY